jgi:hypothetical protein
MVACGQGGRGMGGEDLMSGWRIGTSSIFFYKKVSKKHYFKESLEMAESLVYMQSSEYSNDYYQG